MKKIIAIVLCLALLLTIVACATDELNTPVATETPVVTTAPTTAPTEAPTATTSPTEAPVEETTSPVYNLKINGSSSSSSGSTEVEPTPITWANLADESFTLTADAYFITDIDTSSNNEITNTTYSGEIEFDSFSLSQNTKINMPNATLTFNDVSGEFVLDVTSGENTAIFKGTANNSNININGGNVVISGQVAKMTITDQSSVETAKTTKITIQKDEDSELNPNVTELIIAAQETDDDASFEVNVEDNAAANITNNADATINTDGTSITTVANGTSATVSVNADDTSKVVLTNDNTDASSASVILPTTSSADVEIKGAVGLIQDESGNALEATAIADSAIVTVGGEEDAQVIFTGKLYQLSLADVYTTVAEVANKEDITEIRLLANTSETLSVEIKENVTLNTNGYTWEIESIELTKTGEIINTGIIAVSSKANLAIATAVDGTVQLSSDITADTVIQSGVAVTLDLNGKKLTAESSNTIENNGDLTIDDSSVDADGGIINSLSDKAIILNNVGGVVVINTADMQKYESYYAIQNKGIMTLNENVSLYYDGISSSSIANGWYESTDVGSSPEAVMTINGGTYSGGMNVIKNDNYGVLTINDGIFTLTKASQGNVVLTAHIATINGGVFDCENLSQHDAVVVTYTGNEKSIGELTITGGTFKSHSFGYAVSERVTNVEGANISISGGSYSYLPDPKYYTENANLTVLDGGYITRMYTKVVDGNTLSAYVNYTFESGHTINIPVDAEVTILGSTTLANYGTIINNGEINSVGIVSNYGTIINAENDSKFNVQYNSNYSLSGKFYNYNEFINYGIFENGTNGDTVLCVTKNLGTFTNEGTVNNYGTFESTDGQLGGTNVNATVGEITEPTINSASDINELVGSSQITTALTITEDVVLQSGATLILSAGLTVDGCNFTISEGAEIIYNTNAAISIKPSDVDVVIFTNNGYMSINNSLNIYGSRTSEDQDFDVQFINNGTIAITGGYTRDSSNGVYIENNGTITALKTYLDSPYTYVVNNGTMNALDAVTFASVLTNTSSGVINNATILTFSNEVKNYGTWSTADDCVTKLKISSVFKNYGTAVFSGVFYEWGAEIIDEENGITYDCSHYNLDDMSSEFVSEVLSDLVSLYNEENNEEMQVPTVEIASYSTSYNKVVIDISEEDLNKLNAYLDDEHESYAKVKTIFLSAFDNNYGEFTIRSLSTATTNVYADEEIYDQYFASKVTDIAGLSLRIYQNDGLINYLYTDQK